MLRNSVQLIFAGRVQTEQSDKMSPLFWDQNGALSPKQVENNNKQIFLEYWIHPFLNAALTEN